MLNTSNFPMESTPKVASATLKRNLFFFVICWVVIIDYLDRYIFGSLAESVKGDIALSDTQIGLISGPAFAVTYCLFTIPFGRLADRVSRVAVLGGLLAFWSIGVVVMSIADSFTGLVVGRLLIGIGQAGALAPAHSMVADLFPPHRRGLAMGTLGLAASFGVALGPPIAGVAATLVGWRLCFQLLGGLGFISALIFVSSFKPPIRGASEGRASEPAKGDSFMAAARSLFKRPTYRYLIAALAAATMADYGTQMWVAPLFTRKLNMSLSEIGFEIFLFFGMGSLAGTAAGGIIYDRLVRRDQRWALLFPAITSLLAAPFFAAILVIKDPEVALRFLAIPAFLSMCWMAPAYAVLQSLAGVKRRSTAASIMVFGANLIGGGAGPFLVGALSHFLTKQYGSAALTLSFVAMASVFGIAGLFFLLGIRTLRADLEDARLEY